MVAPFKYDLWTSSDPIRDDYGDELTVHCFMPNGNYILFNCPTTLSLFEMKEVSIRIFFLSLLYAVYLL